MNFASHVSLKLADSTPAEDRDDVRSQSRCIRVLIAGGPSLIRAGLRTLIEKRPDMAIVGDYDDSKSALAALAGDPPDVIVLDANGSDERDELAGEVGAVAAVAPTVVLSTRCDPGVVHRIVLAGASGVVCKDRPAEHLHEAIRKVHEGELWVERLTAAQLIARAASDRRKETSPERGKIASLTRRELDVVSLVARGLANKAIATSMGISENTIRHHLTSIFAKLELADRLELVVYAFRHGLVVAQRA